MGGPNRHVLKMKKKVLTLFLWMLSFALVTAAGWLVLVPEKPPAGKPLRQADGEGVEILSFTAGDKKQIKIRAARQRNAEDRNRYFDEFEAELEPKSAPGEIIHVFADLAYLYDNATNIDMEGHVRIESTSLQLTAPFLSLKGQNHLSGDKEMTFQLNQISGTARKGLSYSMVDEVIKLFDVSGVMDREGVLHEFRCLEMTISRVEHFLHLQGDVRLEGGGKTLDCQILVVEFDEHMRETKSVLAVDGVRLVTELQDEEQGGRRYEFKSGRMSGNYEQGHLRESELRESVELIIQTAGGEITSQSQVFYVHLDPVSGSLTEVEMPEWGEWTFVGDRRRFSVLCDQGRFFFDDKGELDKSEAKHFVTFKMDDYTGGGDELLYQPKRNFISISGPGTWVRRGAQLFHGKTIEVNTSRNELNSLNGVVSSVAMKGRPPFSSEPVMISAKTVSLEDQTDRIRYSGNVELSQEKLLLRCQDLVITEKELTAEKSALFSFQNKTDSVLVMGDSFRISGLSEPQIIVKGKARLVLADNKVESERLVMNWNVDTKGLSTVISEEKVYFSGLGYEVNSDILLWSLDDERLRFNGNVLVKKGKEFESRGEEVEIESRTRVLKILTRLK